MSEARDEVATAHDPRLLVATHKPYWMPSDPLYVPVQVNCAAGGERIPGFAYDDEGDNISGKNARISELTALWWGWHNLNPGYALGLVHYRRHFAGSGERGVLTYDEAGALLQRAPVVVPTARNYLIESVASHYAHTHNPAHLHALRSAVAAVSPERLEHLDAVLSSTKVHMFNMFLMRREVLDPYCSWLFDVLFAIEDKIDFTDMTPFEERCVGRLGEFLLDTWIRSEGLGFVEVRLRELEGTNWVKKGKSFLAAKFLGKRYDQSF